MTALETAASENCSRCGERISTEAEACPACGNLRTDAACARHADLRANGQCVICGSALCDGCNKGGEAHFLCEQHGDIPVVQGWAQVYTTSDELEADLIRDNLEAQGVDARVLSQKDHVVAPVDFGDLSPVRVLVPAYAYSDAAVVIERNKDEQGEVRFGDASEETSPPA